MSAGNDIVALNAIDIARTNHPKFYSRIVSPSEKALYNSAEFVLTNFADFVWLLWSIKEAAFKFLQRNEPDLIFSPTKFIVNNLVIPLDFKPTPINSIEITGFGFNEAAVKGSLVYQSHTIFFRSLLYKELIHSVVNEINNFDYTYWGIKQIGHNDNEIQSKMVREFAIENLQKHTDFENLTFSKNASGIPVIKKGNEEINIPVSLSHHDTWVAYAFQLASKDLFNRQKL